MSSALHSNEYFFKWICMSFSTFNSAYKFLTKRYDLLNGKNYFQEKKFAQNKRERLWHHLKLRMHFYVVQIRFFSWVGLLMLFFWILNALSSAAEIEKRILEILISTIILLCEIYSTVCLNLHWFISLCHILIGLLSRLPYSNGWLNDCI